MTTPQKTIYDCLTGETITRDFNADELAQLELDKAASKKEDDAQKAKAAARQAVLDKLGLTDAEAAVLSG